MDANALSSMSVFSRYGTLVQVDNQRTKVMCQNQSVLSSIIVLREICPEIKHSFARISSYYIQKALTPDDSFLFSDFHSVADKAKSGKSNRALAGSLMYKAVCRASQLA